MAATPGIQLLADLDAATTLAGAELLYGEQGGAAAKITVTQLREGRATLTGTETLTNKTLTAPIINGGTLDGLQAISSPATMRSTLGLGSIATQAASNVAITGGSVTNITDILVADGGTGASTASAARTNLGLAIGSDIQAYDAGLLSIAALTTSANKMIYTTGSDVYAVCDLTVFGRSLIDDVDAATARGTLGLGTIATQAASSVALTGGAIDGVAIGASTASTMRGTTINATTSFQQNGTKVVGAQGAAVADASGGATIDAEARTAINSLLARLRTHGLIAT